MNAAADAKTRDSKTSKQHHARRASLTDTLLGKPEDAIVKPDKVVEHLIGAPRPTSPAFDSINDFLR